MITKFRKYIKIKTKVTLGIVLFALIFMGLISYTSFLSFKKVYKDDLKHHISTMVGIAALQVDANKHNLLISPADENTQNYKDIKKVLQNIRAQDRDITYIYTLRKNENNNIEFVVDAEEDPVNISHLGDVYYDASDLLKYNFDSINSATTEKEFTTDKWGTWLSGYAPVRDENGNKVAVLGLDVKSTDVINKENKVLWLYLITFLLAGLFAALVGIYISKRFTSSIISLNNMLKDEKTLDIFPASNDEIGELKDSFKKIIDKTNESKIETEEQLISKEKTIEEIEKMVSDKTNEIEKLKNTINYLKND